MELYFPLILDGATGTELQKLGYTNDGSAEEWVLAHPEALSEIQRGYVKAGSQIVYAPTFGANRVKLEENGIFNQVREYNLRLTEISKKAVGEKAYVAGDLAPTGKFLAPLGDVTFEELVEIYREQVVALEEAGVDLFVIETIMTVPDARAALLAVKSVSDKPVFVSFTCDENGKTLTGTDVTAALLILQGMGADAFGLNCSVGPEELKKQMERLAVYAEIPLLAKPNAGMPVFQDGSVIYDCSPEEFTKEMAEFASYGVGIFGGCCGTDASHIKALKETSEKITIKRPTAFSERYPDQLPMATEKEVFLLPASAQYQNVYPCDERLGEAIEEAIEQEDAVLAIRISSREELDDFADNQYAITKPLCIVTDDADVLEEALRLYQGRAMYDGTVPEEKLLEYEKKYGLIF